MSSTREVIQAALKQQLLDDDGKPVELTLLPGLTKSEIDEWARAFPVRPPDDYCDLLEFCSGIAGVLEEIDFTGRVYADGLGFDFLTPDIVTIAHDGFGNYWVLEMQPESQIWGPIYFCCHDAPVLLLQAADIRQFVSELFKMVTPPHKSLIDDVHEDRLFDVWRKNPGVVTHAEALPSADEQMRAFASSLEADFQFVDLREAEIGMGFSWGRYGRNTEVRRFGSLPIFAYRRPRRTGFFSKLFGS